MAWYFTHDGADVWTRALAADRDAAITYARNDYEDGRPFRVAEGEGRPAWEELFSDWGDLAEHIDGRHEDRSFEEGFTTEANLGKAELQPLCDQINALWVAFVRKERPMSSLLDLGPHVEVPATPEWLLARAAAISQGSDPEGIS